MSTHDTDLHWHADDDLLAAYVAGRTRPPVTASVEMHLMGCGHCRSCADAARRPGAAARVWDRVADELQAPPRTGPSGSLPGSGSPTATPCWSRRHRRSAGPGCSRCCSACCSPSSR